MNPILTINMLNKWLKLSYFSISYRMLLLSTAGVPEKQEIERATDRMGERDVIKKDQGHTGSK